MQQQGNRGHHIQAAGKMETGRGQHVMGYITSGNAAVDSMGKINISGNVIP